MVPVSGAVKDRGHDIHGPGNVHGGYRDGRKCICRFPTAVTLPDDQGNNSGPCPLKPKHTEPAKGWGNESSEFPLDIFSLCIHQGLHIKYRSETAGGAQWGAL